MSVTFRCQYCEELVEIPEELEGRRGACRKCGRELVYPFFFNTRPLSVSRRITWYMRLIGGLDRATGQFFSIRYQAWMANLEQRRRCRRQLKENDKLAGQFVEATITRKETAGNVNRL